jgi:hypothetical protein
MQSKLECLSHAIIEVFMSIASFKNHSQFA